MASLKDTTVTVSAPTNIACIKYWGKADPVLNTPINSSVSVTLDMEDLRAITTASASTEFEKDRLILNGEEEDIENSARFQACITHIRRLAQDRVDEAGNVIVRKEDWPQYKVLVVSRNTFPTAAGLASSAAGYAALVFALAKLFNAKESYEGEFSAIARQGSGSACRSLYGGFVRWEMGKAADAKDSHAIQIANEHHWPQLRALIMVVSDAKKDTSSTSGMSTSVKTSELLQHRASAIVPGRLERIEAAYLERNFEEFGRITMQDSNQFHATCLDTYPPIFYMNDVSRSIIRIITAYNKYYSQIRAAYTFDAGPNAVIYTLEPYVDELLSALLYFYPAIGNTEYMNKPEVYHRARQGISKLPKELLDALSATGREPAAGDVKFVYYTKAGSGPVELSASEHMVDLQTGQPIPPPKAKKVWRCSFTCNITREGLGFFAGALVGASIATMVYLRRR